MDRIGITRAAAAVGAALALALVVGTTSAQAQAKWRLVGQLEMPAGEVVGPLVASPFGELVAGTTWDGASQFTGRVWSTQDGLQVSALEHSFPSLLPVAFGQSFWDPVTMAAPVFAHSRRGFRSWSIADGALVQDVTFDSDVLANDVLHDPFRGTYIVSQEIGSLLVYDANGERIATIEVDPMRPHRDLHLSHDGGLLVVNSLSFTLSVQLSEVPHNCAARFCAEAYQTAQGSYGPYEELLAFDRQSLRVATLPEVNPERAGLQDGPFRAVAVPTIRIWNDIQSWTSTAIPEREIAGFDSPVVFGQFSADGTQLLTLEEAGHLAIWDAETGSRTFSLRATEGDAIIAARLVPASKAVFIRRSSGVSQLVDTAQGAVIQSLPHPSADVIATADGQTLITYASGESPALVWTRR